ncbi:hypothetical protein ACLKA6_017474 [Drosophila palustris]
MSSMLANHRNIESFSVATLVTDSLVQAASCINLKESTLGHSINQLNATIYETTTIMNNSNNYQRYVRGLTVDHSTMPAPLAPGTQHLTSGLLPNNLHSSTPSILQLDHHPLLHFLNGNTTVSSVVASNVAVAAAAANTKLEHDQASQAGRVSVGNINMLKGENPDRPFGCSVCRRFFSQQSTLLNHIKTHTGEKPYKCKICDVSFRQVATLNNHMKIHTGEKPYNCSYCPKQFRQKSTLQNHERIHKC